MAVFSIELKRKSETENPHLGTHVAHTAIYFHTKGYKEFGF